jgi:hypothetical protein
MPRHYPGLDNMPELHFSQKERADNASIRSSSGLEKRCKDAKKQIQFAQMQSSFTMQCK